MLSYPSSLRPPSDQHIPISGVIVNTAQNNGKKKSRRWKTGTLPCQHGKRHHNTSEVTYRSGRNKQSRENHCMIEKGKRRNRVMWFIPLVHSGGFCEHREDPWCDSTSGRMSLQKLHTGTERGRGDVSIIIFSTHREIYWLSLSTSAAMAHPALLYINSKLFLLRYSNPPTRDTNRARAMVPE